MGVSWKIILLVVAVSDIINYFSIREVLWSVVWLNRGGSQRKLKEYKKTISVNEPLFDRISMRFLLEYVSTCSKEFVIWWKVKRVFVFAESILLIAYFAAGLVWNRSTLFDYCGLFMLCQALLSFIFLRFQFGIGGHLTKYDRMRMKKRR